MKLRLTENQKIFLTLCDPKLSPNGYRAPALASREYSRWWRTARSLVARGLIEVRRLAATLTPAGENAAAGGR